MNGGMSVGIGGGAGGSINGTTKKSNSCSTIYIDDSTVSQPNLKTAIRLVACAIHYHIKRRTGDRSLEIFDERLYPLSRDSAPIHDDYRTIVPDHRVIYKFMKNLFTAAQLTAECAIVTLVPITNLFTLFFVLILILMLLILDLLGAGFDLRRDRSVSCQLEASLVGRYSASLQGLGRSGCLECRLLSDT